MDLASKLVLQRIVYHIHFMCLHSSDRAYCVSLPATSVVVYGAVYLLCVRTLLREIQGGLGWSRKNAQSFVRDKFWTIRRGIAFFTNNVLQKLFLPSVNANSKRWITCCLSGAFQRFRPILCLSCSWRSSATTTYGHSSEHVSNRETSAVSCSAVVEELFRCVFNP